MYTVQLEQFEGPLDLLVQLIEKRKLFINDISLASITEEYLSYAQTLQDTEQKTGFLLIASTLLLLKSRSLLPNLTLTIEEEKQIISLEDRINLYQIAKEAAEHIKLRYGKMVSHTGPDRTKQTIRFIPDPTVNKESFLPYIQTLLNALPAPQEKLPEVAIQKMVSIEEMMHTLEDRVRNALSARFSDIVGTPKTKEEKVFVIVSFLAMLELIRQGIVTVSQDDMFSEITIQQQNEIS